VAGKLVGWVGGRGVLRGREAPFQWWGVARGFTPLAESLSEARSLLTGWVGGRIGRSKGVYPSWRGSLGARSPFRLLWAKAVG